MLSSDCSVHQVNIADPLAGIMVFSHPVRGILMLPALVTKDEVYLCNFAEVVLIGFHPIVKTVTEHCSEAELTYFLGKADRPIWLAKKEPFEFGTS